MCQFKRKKRTQQQQCVNEREAAGTTHISAQKEHNAMREAMKRPWYYIW